MATLTKVGHEKSNDKKLKVLYICGLGRSGSTLLDLLLGQLDGFFSVGELQTVWWSHFNDAQLCGCRKPFRDCDFWKRVVDEAFEGPLPVSKVRHMQSATSRIRHIPMLTTHFKPLSFSQRLQDYSEILTRLYAAIAQVSGADVIVESSKDPVHCFVLNQMASVELYIVHLVRDSRAVSYSWQRRKLRPEIYWQGEYMPTFPISVTAIKWMIINVVSELLKYINGNYILLKYEDFVEHPLEILSHLVTLTKENGTLTQLPRISGLQAREYHSVSGNPVRFHTGEVEFHPDIEWKHKMTLSQKMFVTALTWPALLRYRYPVLT